ncbi:MAG: adenine phosphoribosyltransferase, partial [Clostridium sp.]|nr:adenine phosphoribosyltransferase [Clostridium sp.]
VIEGFPKEGISFKDVTTLIQDKDALKYAIDKMAETLKDEKIDIIVAPEARGFLFGVPLAYALGAGFVPVRKKGKLPAKTIEIKYDLEYGEDVLEMHLDSVKKGQRVAIVDDLLATGGTTESVVKLVNKLGGDVVALEFVVELTGLKGREKFKNYKVGSLVEYDF